MRNYINAENKAVQAILAALKRCSYKVKSGGEFDFELKKLRDGREFIDDSMDNMYNAPFWSVEVCGVTFRVDFIGSDENRWQKPIKRIGSEIEFDFGHMPNGLIEPFENLPEFKIPECVSYPTLVDVEIKDDSKADGIYDLIDDGKFTIQRGDEDGFPIIVTVDGLSFKKSEEDADWEQTNPEVYDFAMALPCLLEAALDDACKKI